MKEFGLITGRLFYTIHKMHFRAIFIAIFLVGLLRVASQEGIIEPSWGEINQAMFVEILKINIIVMGFYVIILSLFKSETINRTYYYMVALIWNYAWVSFAISRTEEYYISLSIFWMFASFIGYRIFVFMGNKFYYDWEYGCSLHKIMIEKKLKTTGVAMRRFSLPLPWLEISTLKEDVDFKWIRFRNVELISGKARTGKTRFIKERLSSEERTILLIAPYISEYDYQGLVEDKDKNISYVSSRKDKPFDILSLEEIIEVLLEVLRDNKYELVIIEETDKFISTEADLNMLCNSICANYRDVEFVIVTQLAYLKYI